MSFVLLGILNSQAGAGGVAPPDFLSSAPLWLDASDASTITESSGSVSQWDNKGAGSNFVQATGADQPTTGVTTLDGKNVIDFASNNMSHAGTLGEFKFMSDGTEFFFAAVISLDLTALDFQTFMSTQTSAGSSSDIGFSGALDQRNSLAVIDLRISNGAGFPMTVGESGFVVSGFSILSAKFDADNATAADRVFYFRNDTQGTNTNSQTAAPSSSTNDTKLTIGSAGSGSSMTGSIGELILVSGADATETNRQAVVDYLNEKWSIFV